MRYFGSNGTIISLAACVLAGAASASAQAAAPVFFETFESYTAVAGTVGDNGDNDPTNPAEDDPVNTANWTVSEPTATDTQVVLGTSTDGLGANQQVLKLSASASNTSRLFPAVSGSGPTAPVLRFKVRPDELVVGDENDVPNAATSITFRGGTSGGGTSGGGSVDLIQTTVGTNRRGFRIVHALPDGTNATVTNIMPTIVAGHWYEVVMTFDFAVSIPVFDVTVTDLDNPVVTATAENLAIRNGLVNLSQLFFSPDGNLGDYQNLSVDDIVITIPEPASAAVLLPALLLLRRHGHRE